MSTLALAGYAWPARAACRGEDPDLFFPVAAGRAAAQQAARALQVCAGCPVSGECLDYAVTNRQVHGVWGGTTEDERGAAHRTALLERRRARRRAA